MLNTNWRTEFAGSKYNPLSKSPMGISQSVLLPSTDLKDSSNNIIISRK